MYLAGQSHDNDLGESAADDVIVIENEGPVGSTSESQQPSSSARDRETHLMRQHPSAQKLRNDEDDVVGDDDEGDDEQKEEELPADNVTCPYIFLSSLKAMPE